MSEVSIVGLDIAKNVFQLYGVDATGACVLERRLKRREVLKVLGKLEAVTVVLEACGSAHYWAREIGKLGHRVKLVPPGFVKRFASGRNKNDRRDARALTAAGASPDLRAVPVKSEASQAEQLRFKLRALMVRQHTQAGNALRGHLAEFGLTCRSGDKALEELIGTIEAGASGLPEAAVAAIAVLVGHWRRLAAEIAKLTAEVVAKARCDAKVKRLMQVPGTGPMIASLFVAKVPDPGRFACGRDCAAWLGLVPREHSSGDRRKLGAITKAGDEDLRSLLVLGAASVLGRAKRCPEEAQPWVRAILARRPFKVAAVALAARMARTLWALLAKQEDYRPPQAHAACRRPGLAGAALCRA